jgi:hypothetical protein
MNEAVNKAASRSDGEAEGYFPRTKALVRKRYKDWVISERRLLNLKCFQKSEEGLLRELMMDIQTDDHGNAKAKPLCSYQDYVGAQCRRNPGLQCLSDFLAADRSHLNLGRIASLEFSSASCTPHHRSLDLSNLVELLQHPRARCGNLLGQMLIVEDLTKDVVEILGSYLQVDPLFLAGHLFSSRVETSTTKGLPYALPPGTQERKYTNIRYNRPIVFDDVSLSGTSRLLCCANVRRKVGISQGLRLRADNVSVGFAQRTFSISMIVEENENWLCK